MGHTKAFPRLGVKQFIEATSTGWSAEILGNRRTLDLNERDQNVPSYHIIRNFDFIVEVK